MNRSQKEGLAQIIEDLVVDSVHEAVQSEDIEKAVAQVINDDYDIEQIVNDCVDSHLCDSTFKQWIDDAVTTALQSMLPVVVRQTAIQLLSDADYLERLTAAIFEKSS